MTLAGNDLLAGKHDVFSPHAGLPSSLKTGYATYNQDLFALANELQEFAV